MKDYNEATKYHECECEEDMPWRECIDSLVVNPEGSMRALELNADLIDDKGLDACAVKRIMQLHEDKIRILDRMELTDDSVLLKYYAGIVTELEFLLQNQWGFPQDRNFHRWWTLPKCTCAKMDNEDMYGTAYNSHSEGCPIHGRKRPSINLNVSIQFLA